jgi:hypothetical protein
MAHIAAKSGVGRHGRLAITHDEKCGRHECSLTACKRIRAVRHALPTTQYDIRSSKAAATARLVARVDGETHDLVVEDESYIVTYDETGGHRRDSDDGRNKKWRTIHGLWFTVSPHSASLLNGAMRFA